jgi:hypothetical protein
MYRRKFLAAAGTAALAGCNSLKAAVRSGPPYFENVEITGPEQVDVGEEFSLELTAKNTGGREGSFSSTLTVGQSIFSVDRTAEIKNIAVSETKTSEIGPMQFDRATELEFRLTEHGASHTVTVQPIELEFDDTFTTADGLEIKPETVVTAPNYFDRYDELVSAEDDDIFVFVEMQFDNTGDATISAPDMLDIVDGATEYQTETSGVADPSLPVAEYPSDISSGEVASGWLRAEVLSTSNSLSVAWENSGLSSDAPERRVTWSFGETQLQQLTGAPEFEIENFEVQPQTERGSEFEVSLTVSNTGQTDGTFRALLSASTMDFDEAEKIKLEVPSGDSATLTRQYQIPLTTSESEFHVDLYPDGPSQTVSTTVMPVQLSIGDSFTVPDSGATISVDQIKTGSNLQVYNSYSGEYSEREAYTEDKWLYAEIAVEDGNESYPAQHEFRAIGEDNTYRPGLAADTRIRGDVQGNQYNSQRTGKNEEPSGWIAYEVDNSVTADSAYIGLYSGNYTIDTPLVVWSTE